jgi:hypothetical protein
MTTATSAHTVRLTEREEIAEGTMAFHFDKPADFQVPAGQTIDVTLLNLTNPFFNPAIQPRRAR